MSRPAPASPESHQSRVLVQLRDRIMKGEFPPGERLAEVSLAALLGVSRTPVRLALATLEREGLVEPSGSVGYVMRRFTLKEILDAIDVRGTLEGMAARLLAENGVPKAVLDEIKACIRAGDALFAAEGQELDYAAYSEMNNRLHDLITANCGNAALARAIEINNRLPFAPASATLPMQSASQESHRWMVFAHLQHRSLVEAIERGQGARAQAIAEEHVQIAKLNMKVALERPEAAGGLMPALKLVAGTTPESERKDPP